MRQGGPCDLKAHTVFESHFHDVISFGNNNTSTSSIQSHVFLLIAGPGMESFCVPARYRQTVNAVGASVDPELNDGGTSFWQHDALIQTPPVQHDHHLL